MLHLDTNPEVKSSVQNNIKHCKQVSPHLKEPSMHQGFKLKPHTVITVIQRLRVTLKNV